MNKRSIDKVVPSLELILSLAWGLMGWYLPKVFLAQQASSIVHKDVSDVVQFISTNDNGQPLQYVVDFELNHPLVEPPTIGSGLLICTGVWVPLAVAVLVVQWQQQQRQAPPPQATDATYRNTLLRTLVCAWATAIGTSEGFTQMLKLYVQRRRPNFIALCGLAVDTATRTVSCTNSPARVIEANLSFPSGHSSLTACGMTFMFFAVASQFVVSATTTTTTLNNNNSNVSWQHARIGICLTGLTAAAYTSLVGASRLVDTWHHPSDVVAGWCLGVAASTAAFCFWFPPLSHVHVGIPWSVLWDGSNTKRGLTSSSSSSSTSSFLPVTTGGGSSSSTHGPGSAKQASFHE